MQIFDITGKRNFKAPIGTRNICHYPKLQMEYHQCTITSNNQRVNKKLVVE
ncbi:MAG: hypothetical protein R2847_09715 [Bacteroidia bacterium]